MRALRRRSALRAAACLALALVGCDQTDVVGKLGAPAPRPEPAAGSAAPAGGAPAAGGAMAPPPVTPVRSAAPSCAAASSVFARALCACGQVATFGDLRSARIAREGAQPALPAADVGIAGTLQVAAFVGPIGGDLIVTGSGLSLIAGVDGAIAGALRVQGDLGVSGLTRIGSDAWLGGLLLGDGVLIAAGDLHQLGASVALSPQTGAPLVDHAGELVSGEFSIDPPCVCEDAGALRIEAAVARAVVDHDGQSAGFAPSALADLPPDQSLSLPPGRLYVEQIRAAGDLTLRVTGRTTLFIAGDLIVHGALRAELSPTAELELWVAGGMAVTGPLALAPRERPSAARMFVAGPFIGEPGPAGPPGDEIVEQLPTPAQRENPDAEWVVNLYAPRFDLSLGRDTDVYGALFVRALLSIGDVRIHHDPLVLERTSECHEP